ncbi:MAG: HAMP domain-containing histidine kinase [Deltaproteobacteria bacterium]|nr:MAG: HAMP domain-containing histidine kinase [Deltaproteobacteria bacterium]
MPFSLNIERAILFGGLFTALLLLGTVGWSSAGVEQAAQGTVTAEGHAYSRLAMGYPPTAMGLAEMVESHPELVYAGYAYPRRGEILFGAGEATPLGKPEAGPLRPQPDGSVLMFVPPPPEHAESFEIEPPPMLVVRFYPALAAQLSTRGRASLAVALVVASLLVLASVWLARTEERARKAQADLAASEHLAQMGEMSAVLAHEIKNPLASLKGHAQLLEELLADSPHQRRAHRVVSEAERLQQLIDSLLAYARRAEIRRRDVQVDELVEEIVGSRPQVKVDCPSGLTWSLDRGLVIRAVGNLVTNALQAGGDEPVDLGVSVVGKKLQFTVRDRGAGLQGAKPEELFAPFATTRTRGTGLGLAIASRIAHAHHGTITAADHPGGGAVFTLTLGGS